MSELRPAHDPTKPHGFVNCVISPKDLSSSIWTWYRDGGKWERQCRLMARRRHESMSEAST
jgi:56kDa selenium binding protein (SBP56)